MADGQGASEVADLLRRHDVRPRKELGQNFLVDPNIVAKIVRVADVGSGSHVIEVGAGTGTLTRALAGTGATVLAFEVDARLRPVLTESLAGCDVDLRFGDAMAADWETLLGASTWDMVANLPYNVGTPLVLRMLREQPRVVRYVVMVQAEVADRLLADPGSRVYGLPSVVAGLFGEARRAFSVAPQVFHPRPRVESTVVIIERYGMIERGAHLAADIAAVAFGQRRKMLRRSLAGYLDRPEEALTAAGLDPTLRAENLAPGDYLRLAAVLSDEV